MKGCAPVFCLKWTEITRKTSSLGFWNDSVQVFFRHGKSCGRCWRIYLALKNYFKSFQFEPTCYRGDRFMRLENVETTNDMAVFSFKWHAMVENRSRRCHHQRMCEFSRLSWQKRGRNVWAENGPICTPTLPGDAPKFQRICETAYTGTVLLVT